MDRLERPASSAEEAQQPQVSFGDNPTASERNDNRQDTSQEGLASAPAPAPTPTASQQSCHCCKHQPQQHRQRQQRHNKTKEHQNKNKMLPSEASGEWIMLNVGGKIFTTTRTTLCTNEPNSMLARMFSQHEHFSSLAVPSLGSQDEGDDEEDEENFDDDGDEVDQELQNHLHSSPVRAAALPSATPDQHQNNRHNRRRHRATKSAIRQHQSQQIYHNSSTFSLRPSPRDSSGAYLIDRSPQYFEPILNYLRHGKLIIDHNVNVQGVLEEAKFYGIVSLLPMLELETERWFKKRHHDVIQSQLNYDNQQSFQSQLQQQQAYPYSNNINSINNRLASPQPQQPQRQAGNSGQQSPPLTRQDVIKALIRTSGQTRELRFQGCNLNGADLSKLDLRSINFRLANLRYCNFRGANLSYANMERANMFGCNLEGTQLIGTNLSFANMENSNLRAVTTIQNIGLDLNQNNRSLTNNNNDETNNNVAAALQIGQQMNILEQHKSACLQLACATFECANLRQTNLEGSQLQGANFRKAILRGSNLQNCDLTRANLCGADLENCDLSGSDLSEANLRKANVKGAQFELEVS